MTTALHPERIYRVACFSPYPETGPSVRHRIVALAPFWRDHGVELCLFPFMSERFYAIRKRFDKWGTVLKALHLFLSSVRLLYRVLGVVRFDAVIIHREAFPFGPAWIETTICRLNKNVYFDFDDAIWVPPTMAINQRKWLWSEGRVGDILKRCKAVIAGNTYLADFASQFNANVHVVATGYDDLAQPAQGSQDTSLIPCIVWIGNEGNAEYLNLVLPTLEKLAKMYRFRLRIIGADDIWQIRSATLEIEYCRWHALREVDWLKTADIGIMPLYDAPYEQGKCGFKLIQYWSAGLPVIASPVGVNREYVEQNKNGCLAATPAEWEAALSNFLQEPGGLLRRKKMAHAGRETYLKRFTRGHCATVWLDVFAASGWYAHKRQATESTQAPC